MIALDWPWSRLTSGPNPITTDPADFFAARLAMIDAAASADRELEGYADRPWRALLPTCRQFDRVELWIDPEPHAQLLLVQLLDWFGNDPELVAKTFLMHADSRSAGVRPMISEPCNRRSTMSTLTASISRCERGRPTDNRRRRPGASCSTATWTRYRAFARRSVYSFLGELPDARTALMASERRFLDGLARGATTMHDLLQLNAEDPACVFDYWDAGRIIDGLAHCPAPAILGLEVGPFDLAMHQDPDRHQRYFDNRLSLSTLGHSLLEGRDDFSRHNPIRRWWGGTWLRNESLWRWDVGSSSLVDPRPTA